MTDLSAPSSTAAHAAPHRGPADAMGVVAVRIGAQEFALDILSVREIRGWTPPIPLPRAPAYVQGMSDLRGVVIPIIDLGARLGLKATSATATSVVIVVQIRERLAGLLVDGVSDLIDIDPGRLQATPETGSAGPGQVIRGIFEIHGRILGLIALETVIPADLGDTAELAS